ncbi:MAG: hypothetical protein AB1721_02445 [Patescibacteria group bacterium]
MNWKRVEVFLEFLIFGILIGIIEDLIAIKVATGQPITFQVFKAVFLIAIPFAFLGEIVVDKIDFVEIMKRIFKKNVPVSRIEN